MNESKQLEGHAVASAEIHGKRAGAGLAHQARGYGIPGGIGDLRLPDIPLRHFACGKYGECTALAQPLDGLFQGFQISLGRRCRVKGIYEKTMFMKLGNSFEQRVGHHAYVRPHTRQKCAQRGSIEHSERMVRYGYQRAFCGDAFKVSGLDLQVHVHLI